MTGRSGTAKLIGQLHNLELSEEPRKRRWRDFQVSVQELGHRGDELRQITSNEDMWTFLFAQCLPAGHARLSQLRMDLLAQTTRDHENRRQVGETSRECMYKQEELMQNTSTLVLKAVEGNLAYRPPPFADVAFASQLRIDLFNPGLGAPQPPHGPPDINDGYGDPGVEDAQGIVRPRPLVRPDLIVDPTNIIQTSNF